MDGGAEAEEDISLRFSATNSACVCREYQRGGP